MKSQIKWWQWCIATAVLTLFLVWAGNRALNPTPSLSEKIEAGATPVIEREH